MLGSVPLLPRFQAASQRIEDDRKLAKLLLAGEAVATRGVIGATAAGDRRLIRGIPAVSRGTSGAIVGTNPVAALLRKERERRS